MAEVMDTVEDKVGVTNIFRPADGHHGLGGLMNNCFGNNGAAWGVGGLVLGALIGNNGGGLFGNNRDGATTALAGVDVLQNEIRQTAIQEKLGSIQTGTAVSAAEIENVVTTQANNTNMNILTQALASQQSMGHLAMGVANAASSIKDTVVCSSAANLAATNNVGMNVERAQYAITQAVNNDGEKTRALIVRQYEDTLNRQLADAKNEIIELRHESQRTSDRDGIRIEMINNQSQNQLQFQQQAQLQQQLLGSLGVLCNQINNVEQVARATNSNIIVGSAGARTGTQNANPTNVNG